MAGNYSRKVSYSAWDDGIHSDRQLFAKGFLYGMRRMAFIVTGNYLRKVSYPAWEGWCSKRQETVCERFPVRRGTDGVHSGGKLFAKGFLFGVGRMVYIATGNYLRKVSYSA